MSGSGELNIAVVGLGFGSNHARVLSELDGVRLAAVCDSNPQRLDAVSAGGGLQTYTDYETMLATEKLDAVVVAVPARLHCRVALAAIAAGSAVLVEKPLAPNLEDAIALSRAAAAAGVALMPGHIERFNPALQELARRVQAGEIGRVLHMSARRMGPIVVRAQDVNVVHDSALHDIDAMRFITGVEVERVYGESQTRSDINLEVSLAAQLRFASPDGDAGAIGSLEVNWLSPVILRDLSVLGEHGLLVLNYANQALRLYQTQGNSARAASRGWTPGGLQQADGGVDIAVEAREPLKEELRAFAGALRGQTPMPVTAKDALAAVAIADALTLSARTGRTVAPAGWE